MQYGMTRKEACFYLGVSENATMEDVKRAYRNKVKMYHPDVNPNAHDYYIKIQSAYEYLINNPYNVVPNVQFSPMMQSVARPARVFSSTAQTRAVYNRHKEQEREIERLRKRELGKNNKVIGKPADKQANPRSKEEEALEKIRALWLAETVKKQIERDKVQKENMQRKKLYEAFLQHDLNQKS